MWLSMQCEDQNNDWESFLLVWNLWYDMYKKMEKKSETQPKRFESPQIRVRSLRFEVRSFFMQGDFVDRGYNSLEVFTILMLLKARWGYWCIVFIIHISPFLYLGEESVVSRWWRELMFLDLIRVLNDLASGKSGWWGRKGKNCACFCRNISVHLFRLSTCLVWEVCHVMQQKNAQKNV